MCFADCSFRVIYFQPIVAHAGFEQSPFKLTPEFVDVMDGPESALWTEFQHLLLKALMAARKHMDRVINLVEIMRSSTSHHICSSILP